MQNKIIVYRIADNEKKMIDQLSFDTLLQAQSKIVVLKSQLEKQARAESKQAESGKPQQVISYKIEIIYQGTTTATQQTLSYKGGKRLTKKPLSNTYTSRQAANDTYNKKRKQIAIAFLYEKDYELLQWLQEQSGTTSDYIKRLIKEDMERNKQDERLNK